MSAATLTVVWLHHPTRERLVIMMTTDLTSVIRGALRSNAFANSGSLPPSRLNTIAQQLAQFLSEAEGRDTQTLGFTLCQQGLGLHSLLAVWQTVQAQHLRHNAPGEVLETARRMGELVEAFVTHQMSRARSEQERMRRAVQTARPTVVPIVYRQPPADEP